MELYASNGRTSKSVRRHAHAHRPFGVVDLESNSRPRVDRADADPTRGHLTRLAGQAAGADLGGVEEAPSGAHEPGQKRGRKRARQGALADARWLRPPASQGDKPSGPQGKMADRLVVLSVISSSARDWASSRELHSSCSVALSWAVSSESAVVAAAASSSRRASM